MQYLLFLYKKIRKVVSTKLQQIAKMHQIAPFFQTFSREHAPKPPIKLVAWPPAAEIPLLLK